LYCSVSVPCYYLAANEIIKLYAFHEAGVDTVDILNGDTKLFVQRVR